MGTLKGKQIMLWTFMGNARMYEALRDYGDRISQIGLFSFKVRATGEIYASGVSIADGSTMRIYINKWPHIKWVLTMAAHQLGKCWRDGLGVIPDDEQTEKWFRLSAEAGNDYSQYTLGKLLQAQGRIEEAVEWYEMAAEQGNQYANYRLGKLYLAGEDMPKDVNRAVEYLTASAEAGNQYAQYTLGKLYLEGQKVEQNRETAYVWFAQSAAQGNAYAQFFLNSWDTLGQPSVMLSVTRLLHHTSRISRDAPLPQDATTMRPHMDRKRVQKLNELKQARGQRIDDHSGHSMGGMGGMTMSGW